MRFAQASHRSGPPRSVSRRELLQVGSLGLTGLTVPSLLRSAAARGLRPAAAKSCLLFFLDGGPGQQDMWDMKPDAPVEIRGEFQPIATSVPGVQVCEGLPLLSQQMHHLALIRSVHHDVLVHSAATYYMLTGRHPQPAGKLIIKEHPDNFPAIGSVFAQQRPHDDIPEFVHLPDIIWDAGHDLPGQRAGFLGPGYDPLVVGDPSVPNYRVPGLTLPEEITRSRLDHRRSLLQLLDRAADDGLPEPAWESMDGHTRKAFSLLSSSKTREAFDLGKEPDAIRRRYGLPDRVDRTRGARNFGGLPHLGQSLLLARRLIEAGIPLVTVCSGRRRDSAWDGHLRHFPILRKSLLPYFDPAFSTLLQDMNDRGLLEETLIVVMGEFGRTPKMGQVTVGAATSAEGRDHWSHCYTILMGGAGIQRGTVFGASDPHAAYPADNPVTPEDVVATIYFALGIDPKTRIEDPLGKPYPVALGEPIHGVFA
ncbi:MAG: hypothetical protein CMJ65_09245 [Planctomycetaceae bacterium]|nr:hypothetical protein [Planctomycetaceae bacterium]MDP7275523.1 DUF1501 domain-containing protein [Planctomycetaceae bacterium]